jgi:hypothetical protein
MSPYCACNQDGVRSCLLRAAQRRPSISKVAVPCAMNHKRRKPKAGRAGCLLCKPNKMSGWPRLALGHAGFGKLRREAHAADDVRRHLPT